MELNNSKFTALMNRDVSEAPVEAGYGHLDMGSTAESGYLMPRWALQGSWCGWMGW